MVRFCLLTTICTMKIILLVLAGLSLAHADSVHPQTEDPVMCLQNALKNTDEFLSKLSKFLCCYYDGSADCLLDKMHGLNHGEIETLLSDLRWDVKIFGKKVIALLDKLGLIRPAAHLLCKLDLLTDAAWDLKRIIFQGKHDSLTLKDFRDIIAKVRSVVDTVLDGAMDLENLGCFVDTVLDGVTGVDSLLGNLGTDSSLMIDLVLATLKALLDMDPIPKLSNLLG